MNRLTAIGLASLVAYGLLIASKYTGMVSAARDERSPQIASLDAPSSGNSGVQALRPEPRQSTLASLPSPLPRAQVSRMSGVALEFRNTRDLKGFADTLASRAGSLSGDERYHLAKALEECLFATTVNEDLAAYSAKQKRQFLSGLPNGDANNAKRIAAYDAVDSTQRCIGFQNAKLSQKDIDALYAAAAQQGDPRAQARIITAELSKNIGGKAGEPGTTMSGKNDDFSTLVGLLESRDPEATMIVGQFLAQSAISQNLRIGPPNAEMVPEASAFLGAFTLVACDLGGPECTNNSHRDLLQACAYGGYCDAQTFERLYQDFLASPWSYSLAIKYRSLIQQAIDQHDWALIGITPKLATRIANNPQK